MAGIDIPTALGIVENAITQAGAFEAGQPILVDIPTQTYTLTLPLVGKVNVTETGAKVTIQKAL